MRAVVYEDVGGVRVADVAAPGIEDERDAIVRVRASAICGSDLHFYHGKAPLSPGDPLGHEAVGVVEEVGAAVAAVAPGDRVAVAFNIVCGACWFCRGGQTSQCDAFRSLGVGILGGGLGGAQAELLRVPDADVNLLPISDDVDDEHALFLGDILTTGYYGAQIGGIEEGDTVAVVGAGPVGFFAGQAAGLRAPAHVLALDLSPERLSLVEGVGLTPIDVSKRNPHTAVAEHTEGRGADVVLEAVGSVPAFETALDVVRPGGRICVLGMYVTEVYPMQLGVMWSRMLDLRFGGVAPIHAWWREALEMVRAGRIDPLPLISHRLPLDDAPEGYGLFDRREATKVVLLP